MTEATSDDQQDGAGHEETRSDTGNTKPDERQSAYFLTPEQIWDPLFGPSGPQEDSIEKIEQKIFLRLLEATRNILSPKVFYFCHDTGSHLKKKIRIAVNTREIPIKPKSGPEARQKKWVLEQRTLDKKDSKQTQLHRIEGAPIEDWQRQFSDDLREMASARQERSMDDSGPDFICFPEFSFPFDFPWQRGKKGKKKKDKSEAFFDSEIEAIARSTNRFFFFGSAHDQHRLKNTGAICAFGPHAPLPRKMVFDRKFESIRHLPEFNGLVFSVIGDEPSQQVVVNAGLHPPISTRAELQRALKDGQITKAQKDTIRDAFDYFDSIAVADSEIITINKKAAAIKLTEYLEPEG